jgi:PrtD family type I secretion system ABC transporter
MADKLKVWLPPKGQPVREAIAANRRLLMAAFAFSGAMSILALTTSFYMLQVYDRVLTSRSGDTLLLLSLIAVAGIMVFGWLDSLRLRLLQRFGMRTAEVLSERVLRAMIAISAQNTGSTVRNGLRDLDSVRNFLGSPALSTLMDAPFVVVFWVVLALLHPIMLAVVLFGALLLVGITILGQRMTDSSLTKAIGQQVRAHNFADDGLRNADVLEGMGMSQTFVEKWRKQWIESLRLSSFSADRDSKLSSASRAVRLLIQIALLGVGALLILDLQATGGVMIAGSIIGARALAPIETGVASWKSFVAARLAWTRLDEMIMGAPKRDEGMKLPAPKGALSAQRIGYQHPASRKVILSNVSFEIDPGDVLGVIGPSASGKSTLVRLLIGAWPCTAGAVRLDGADIYGWPRGELSPYIGYLPQDVELFTGTIRENIARMMPGDPQAVVSAAQRAGAHEMILSLPKGYDTEIGAGGIILSGGQAQRIGIARAMYGDPRLIILDEPNSNLDGPGEEALAQSLALLKQAKVTVIIVAHRPSVLASVDKILAMRGGQVEAFGPRNDVLQKYARRGAAPAAGNVVNLPVAPADGTKQ